MKSLRDAWTWIRGRARIGQTPICHEPVVNCEDIPGHDEVVEAGFLIEDEFCFTESYPRSLYVPTGEMSWETGPLSVLFGRRVLAVFDCENLSISAEKNFLTLSYGCLLAVLRSAAVDCEAHAFFSRMPGDDTFDASMKQAGLITHPRDIEFIESRTGTRKLANSDSRLLFTAGRLLAQTNADTLLIGSGDGDLGCELATGVMEMGRSLTILTLSIAGSSSRRLDAATNKDVYGNLEVGLDVMQPIHAAAWNSFSRRHSGSRVRF